MSCGVGRRHSLDSVLLWLWCRPAAVAPIRPLAWELPYATGCGPKKKKKKKKETLENSTRINSTRITNSNMTPYGFPMQGITQSAILTKSLYTHQALGPLDLE